MFRQDFTCPALLEVLIFKPVRAVTHYGPTFQTFGSPDMALAWSAFARHY